MARIISISIPEGDLELFNAFNELRWKEKKNTSELVVLSIKEYYKNHSQADNQPTLDPFQDKNFRACPTFFTPREVIKEYLASLKGSALQDFIFKMQEWQHTMKEFKI